MASTGVISYSVSQRVNEVGARTALGADKSAVFRMVVGPGVALALAGLAIVPPTLAMGNYS